MSGDYDALLAVNRRLHAEIAEVQSGHRCPRCWALLENGHYADCGGTENERLWRAVEKMAAAAGPAWTSSGEDDAAPDDLLGPADCL